MTKRSSSENKLTKLEEGFFMSFQERNGYASQRYMNTVVRALFYLIYLLSWCKLWFSFQGKPGFHTSLSLSWAVTEDVLVCHSSGLGVNALLQIAVCDCEKTLHWKNISHWIHFCWFATVQMAINKQRAKQQTDSLSWLKMTNCIFMLLHLKGDQWGVAWKEESTWTTQNFVYWMLRGLC